MWEKARNKQFIKEEIREANIYIKLFKLTSTIKYKLKRID